MKIHSVRGGGGLNLHVREWGNAEGPPILLVHGWSQNHLCWLKQYESESLKEFRTVALDLRGHGMSDAPLRAEQYTDGDHWADDIAAIIDQLALDRPTLVGWSYGGLIACDYVRKHGQDRIAGVNFVGAAVVLGQKAFGPLIGPGFLDNAPGGCHPDLPTNIAAMRKFLRDCIVKPVAEEDFETLLAFNMVVPREVRAYLTRRELDFAPVLRGLRVPVLVTHGSADKVVLPAMGHYVLEHCTMAEASWFDGAGHAVFLEEPGRFNSELARFAKSART